MKKYIITSIALLSLSACGGGSSSSTTPAPNSITGTWNNVAGSSNGYTPASADTPPPIGSLTYTGNGSLLYLANGTSQIWQYSSTATPNWSAFESLPAVTSSIATNSGGTLYTGLSNGQVYTLINNTQTQIGSGTENSNVNSLLVITGNTAYLGNQAGNVWYNSNSGAWSQLSNPGFNASITQLAIDSPTSPQYLGVAAGANVWACKFGSTLNSCTWKNLISEAGSQYTDTGSQINAIAFNVIGRYDYGYIGNSDGHVWRSTYDTATSTANDFRNMTTAYPGYAGSGAITSLLVDSVNDVYAGTANGQVWLWTPGTNAWSNLTASSTFSGGSSAITSLTLTSPTSHTVYVGNQAGQVWQVSWSGS